MASGPAQRLSMRAGPRSGLVNVFPETSKHSHALLHCRAGDGRLEFEALDPLCVGVLVQTRELAPSRKRVGEKVSLLLRIQHPSALAGLERWNAANLGFVSHNFWCLHAPQLESRPKTTHFLGGTSGAVVISHRKPCAACESRFLLTHAARLASTRATERSFNHGGRGLVSDVIPTCVSKRVLEPLPVGVSEQPHLSLGHDL